MLDTPRRSRSIQSGWHHVTNRGLDRRTVFRTDADRVDFGQLVGTGHEQFGVEVLAYCLMDNHFHLVLNCPDGGLSAFMQHVGASFTRHANERSGGDGPIFRSRFFSRTIVDERYLANAVRYVHRNPLDCRPVVALDEYRWSSHRTYLGRRQRPPWLNPYPILEWFDDVAHFDRFVTADVHGSEPIAGGAEALIAACEAALDVHAPDDRAAQGRLRTALYLLLDRVDAVTRVELMAFLSPSTPTALAQALRRARHAENDPTMRAILRSTVDLAGAFTLCQTQRERRPTG